MRSVWYSLLWKEWQEHQWKVASITAVLISVPAANVFWSLSVRGVVDWVLPILLAGALFAGLFLGMGAAAGERDCGTARFLAAFPVPTWKIAVAKLIVGTVSLLLSIVPLIVLAYVLSLLFKSARLTAFVRPDETIGQWLVSHGFLGWVASVGVFAWTACCGVRAKTQVRAGAIALAVALLWWAVLFWAETPGNVVTRACPVVPLAMPRAMRATYAWPTAPTLLVTLGLFAAYVVFYRPDESGRMVGTHAIQGAHLWLGPPRRSRLGSIAWKQWREARPYLFGILALAIGGCLFVSAVEYPDRGGWEVFESFVDYFPYWVLVWGFPAAILIGIGTFVSDLRPQANSFWRSRPVSPHLWFWTKMLTGLLGIATLLWLPSLLVTPVSGPHGPDWHTYGGHFVTFTIAVACACLIRRVIYAGIIAVGLSASQLLSAEWFDLRGYGESVDVVFSIVIAVLATLIAWYSASRDVSVDA